MTRYNSDFTTHLGYISLVSSVIAESGWMGATMGLLGWVVGVKMCCVLRSWSLATSCALSIWDANVKAVSRDVAPCSWHLPDKNGSSPATNLRNTSDFWEFKSKLGKHSFTSRQSAEAYTSRASSGYRGRAFRKVLSVSSFCFWLKTSFSFCFAAV